MERMDDKIESLEKEVKYHIIEMEENGDERISGILEDTKSSLLTLFQESKEKMKESMSSQETKEHLHKLKEESLKILELAKQKIEEFNSSDEVVEGKKKLNKAAVAATHYISNGIDEIMKNDTVNRTVDTIADKVDDFCKDERVVKQVNKIKKGTLKLAENAFEGLKRVLDTDDKKEEK